MQCFGCFHGVLGTVRSRRSRNVQPRSRGLHLPLVRSEVEFEQERGAEAGLAGQTEMEMVGEMICKNLPHQDRRRMINHWADAGASSALCLLELDARQRAASSSRNSGCVLPECLYSRLIAPFLRFDEPLPNQLYVLGGRNEQQEPLDVVEMFDTWHGRWTSCPSMYVKRAGCAAASLPNGSLMVVGGYDDRGIVEGLLSSCEVFDPVCQRWTPETATLGRARWGHSCASLGGYTYAVGGCSLQPGAPYHETFMETLRSCEVYYPETNLWLPCDSLRIPRAGARVVALSDRYLAAVGGCDDVFGRAELLSSVELLDVRFGHWTLLETQLVSPRTTAAVAALDDRTILVAGGAPSLASAEVFEVLKPGGDATQVAASEGTHAEDIITNATPRAVRDMAEGRMGCQAVTMNMPEVGKPYPLCTRRCVVVVGGENGDDEQDAECRQFSSVLVYDRENSTWHPQDLLPPLPTTRTAMALCVGKGRIIGHP